MKKVELRLAGKRVRINNSPEAVNEFINLCQHEIMNGLRIPVNILRMSQANHEIWITCTNCGMEFDARSGYCCDNCGHLNDPI